jgi:hypothetical protein
MCTCNVYNACMYVKHVSMCKGNVSSVTSLKFGYDFAFPYFPILCLLIFLTFYAVQLDIISVSINKP